MGGELRSLKQKDVAKSYPLRHSHAISLFGNHCNANGTVVKVAIIQDPVYTNHKNIKIHPLATAKMVIMLLDCFTHSQRLKFKVRKDL